MVSRMPPSRSKPLREADVWLDETLWGDEPTPRRRRADQIGSAEADRGSVGGLFDHEHDLDDGEEIVARRTAPRAARRTSGPAPVVPTADRGDTGTFDALPPSEPEEPETDEAPVVAGPVPGLLRRPLVEVQRTLPGADRRRSLPSGPDRIALLAVALAVLTLVSAIISAHA